MPPIDDSIALQSIARWAFSFHYDAFIFRNGVPLEARPRENTTFHVFEDEKGWKEDGTYRGDDDPIHDKDIRKSSIEEITSLFYRIVMARGDDCGPISEKEATAVRPGPPALASLTRIT